MKAIYPAAIGCTALLALVHSSAATPVFQDDFSDAGELWATRAVDISKVLFDADTLILEVASNPQPVSAYRTFPAISLNDGDTLRLSVDVSISLSGDSLLPLRVALGYANPVIEGESTLIDVPLAGYHMSIPTSEVVINPRVAWVKSDGNDVAFFNSETAVLGDLLMASHTAVTPDPKKLVMEIARLGDLLALSGSLDGIPFANTIDVSDENVIPGFRFNTVGLSYGFEEGSSAIFDNVSVELIPQS
jgi:hypothetical protein